MLGSRQQPGPQPPPAGFSLEAVASNLAAALALRTMTDGAKLFHQYGMMAGIAMGCVFI